MLSSRFKFDKKAVWNLNENQKLYRDIVRKKISEDHYKLISRNNCLICGSDDLLEICAKDRFGLPFGSKICKGCGLIMGDKAFVKDSLKEFYENDYHFLNYGQKTEYTTQKGHGEKIFSYIYNYIKDRDKVKILDVGASSGFVLDEIKRLLLEENIEVEEFGLEYNLDYVEKAKNKDINVLHGGVERLPDIDKKFDLIIFSHVLEHFFDPLKELNLIKDYIKENSLLYIEVPGIFNLINDYVYECDYLKYRVCAHYFDFCLTSLTNLMHKSDFKLVKGDEEVKTIFKYKENTVKRNNINNCFESELLFLNKLEKNRETLFEKLKNKNDFSFMQNSIGEYIDLFNESSLVIFGAGNFGKKFLKKLDSVNHNIKIKCFMDNDENKWGNRLSDIKIIKPTLSIIKQVDKVVIASTWKNEIKNQLLNMNIKREKIIVL